MKECAHCAKVLTCAWEEGSWSVLPVSSLITGRWYGLNVRVPDGLTGVSSLHSVKTGFCDLEQMIKKSSLLSSDFLFLTNKPRVSFAFFPSPPKPIRSSRISVPYSGLSDYCPQDLCCELDFGSRQHEPFVATRMWKVSKTGLPPLAWLPFQGRGIWLLPSPATFPLGAALCIHSSLPLSTNLLLTWLCPLYLSPSDRVNWPGGSTFYCFTNPFYISCPSSLL